MRFRVDNSLYLTPEALEWIRRAEQQEQQTHQHARRPVAPHRHQGTRNADGPISLIGLVAVILLVLGVIGFSEIERAHRLQQTANTVIQMQAPQQRHVVPRRHVAPRRPRREPAKKPVITSSWKSVRVGTGGDLWNSPYTSGRVIGRIRSGSYIQYQEYKMGWYRVITDDRQRGFAGIQGLDRMSKELTQTAHRFVQMPGPQKRVVPTPRRPPQSAPRYERNRNIVTSQDQWRPPYGWKKMKLYRGGRLWDSPHETRRALAFVPNGSTVYYRLYRRGPKFGSASSWIYEVMTEGGRSRGYSGILGNWQYGSLVPFTLS